MIQNPNLAKAVHVLDASLPRETGPGVGLCAWSSGGNDLSCRSSAVPLQSCPRILAMMFQARSQLFLKSWVMLQILNWTAGQPLGTLPLELGKLLNQAPA